MLEEIACERIFSISSARILVAESCARCQERSDPDAICVGATHEFEALVDDVMMCYEASR